MDLPLDDLSGVMQRLTDRLARLIAEAQQLVIHLIQLLPLQVHRAAHQDNLRFRLSTKDSATASSWHLVPSMYCAQN